MQKVLILLVVVIGRVLQLALGRHQQRQELRVGHVHKRGQLGQGHCRVQFQVASRGWDF